MISREQIDEWCETLVRRFRPQKVVLFGSFAEGAPTDDSDVDLLVVMPFQGRAVEQAVKMRLDTRPQFPVDLLVRTPEMVDERLRMGDSFMRDVFERGKILYEASHL